MEDKKPVSSSLPEPSLASEAEDFRKKAEKIRLDLFKWFNFNGHSRSITVFPAILFLVACFIGFPGAFIANDWGLFVFIIGGGVIVLFVLAAFYGKFLTDITENLITSIALWVYTFTVFYARIYTKLYTFSGGGNYITCGDDCYTTPFSSGLQTIASSLFFVLLVSLAVMIIFSVIRIVFDLRARKYEKQVAELDSSDPAVPRYFTRKKIIGVIVSLILIVVAPFCLNFWISQVPSMYLSVDAEGHLDCRIHIGAAECNKHSPSESSQRKHTDRVVTDGNGTHIEHGYSFEVPNSLDSDDHSIITSVELDFDSRVAKITTNNCEERSSDASRGRVCTSAPPEVINLTEEQSNYIKETINKTLAFDKESLLEYIRACDTSSQ